MFCLVASEVERSGVRAGVSGLVLGMGTEIGAFRMGVICFWIC